MVLPEFDVFVSHASEDKARFVNALVDALRERGLRVWYDTSEIRLGDDFRLKIDEGLAQSCYGVVVLSPNFFKYWPQAELSALFNQERVFDQARILPVRLDLDHSTLTRQSPLLATRAALGWELGVRGLAEKVYERVRGHRLSMRLSPVYNAPARRARRLFGREVDLTRLDELLVPGRNVRVAASIEGLAGVGKTELALHAVDRLSQTQRFPGGIFWLDAENPDLTVAWGTTIADALAVGSGTLEERAAGAVRIASSGAPVLVVLDNVERWTRESEPKPLPYGPQTALLVTTRHRFLAGPTFDHHTVDTLPADAARELLVFVAGRDLTGTDELLGHLDGHTLAIELAGAYLREFPSVTPGAYLDKLMVGAPVEEKVQDLVRYEATVHRALELHWRQLGTRAREALIVAACFAPEDASTELLEACGVDAEAQQPLRRFHLIVGDGKRWRMHRLVHAWARRTAGPDDLAQARRRFVEGCAEFSRQITFVEGLHIFQSDGPHLEQAARDAESAIGANDARFNVLLTGVATALKTRADLRDVRKRAERALTGDLKRLGDNHRSVAIRRSNLALVLQALGDLPRAKELLELALDSDLRNLGEDHPAVAMRRSKLALVLRELGELRRAKDLLRRALASELKRRRDDHPSVTATRFNLALVLRELGDLSSAKDELRRVLASVANGRGAHDPSVAIINFILGSISRDCGDLEDARAHFAQTLSAEEQSVGADHPSTAFTRASLAHVLRLLGETTAGRAEAERALKDVANEPVGSHFRVRVERLVARVLHP